jgi:hypothetical protein
MLIDKTFCRYFKETAMTKNPISDFWDNYDCLLQKDAFMSAIDVLLEEFRSLIEDSSKTAQAIDKQESLDSIANYAKEENYYDLAEILGLAT